MSESLTLKQTLKQNQPNYDIQSITDNLIITAIERYFKAQRAGLGRRTVSAYQKAILEAEYDRLLMELI